MRVIDIVLGVIGLFIVIINWYIRYYEWFVVAKMSQEEQDKRLGTPPIPIIGGLFVCMSLASLPVPTWVFFLPFILDYGCLPGAITFIIGIALNITPRK